MNFRKESRQRLLCQLPAYVKYLDMMTERGMDNLEATLAYMEEPDLPGEVRRNLEHLIPELRRGKSLKSALSSMIGSELGESSYLLNFNSDSGDRVAWEREIALASAWQKASMAIFSVTVYAWFLMFAFLGIYSYCQATVWPVFNQIFSSLGGSADLWSIADRFPLSLSLGVKALIVYMNWGYVLIGAGLVGLVLIRSMTVRGSLVKLMQSCRHFYQSMSCLMVGRAIEEAQRGNGSAPSVTHIEMMRNVPGPEPFRRAMNMVGDAMVRGGSISSAMMESGYFDGELCYEIALGEQSEDLTAALGRVAEEQTEAFRRGSETLARKMEPFLCMGITFLAAGMVIGFYSILQGYLFTIIQTSF
ncbi:MAG: hypothetical protein CVV64_10825 [Candidatus Wallbacteria bacterium HGW-Wallbacteria-1]|jgi:type II secretory pathway component PulF|uniref:Type II secretion system protein GspF domain-containing protein n=1 Tax=Candidatus Wallbacteria bacterium HGW-Wallbacteria-1 TaxID=2013854 RepID=A0A2N1PPE5_9BACT|nr:MAG: hypothetical protein CVV64_10825 [Candidatus Wallbacteria bacterium HGW-Wallbacteria-1]